MTMMAVVVALMDVDAVIMAVLFLADTVAGARHMLMVILMSMLNCCH